MADQTFATSVIHPAEGPAVRTIGPEDLRAALVAGFNDFWAVPTHVVFLAIIYPVLGFILTRVTMGEDLLPLVYPLIAGFALIGPFAALGLYEMSRRREQGATPTWQDALRVAHSPARGSIAALGLLQVAIFVAWIATANAIYAGLFGPEHPASAGDFLRDVLTTSNGWALILVGNAVGFVFAAVAFTVSVVSFPLLLDRNVSAATALLTSVRAVRRNPGTMAIWAAILAAALLLGSPAGLHRPRGRDAGAGACLVASLSGGGGALSRRRRGGTRRAGLTPDIPGARHRRHLDRSRAASPLGCDHGRPALSRA